MTKEDAIKVLKQNGIADNATQADALRAYNHARSGILSTYAMESPKGDNKLKELYNAFIVLYPKIKVPKPTPIAVVEDSNKKPFSFKFRLPDWSRFWTAWNSNDKTADKEYEDTIVADDFPLHQFQEPEINVKSLNFTKSMNNSNINDSPESQSSDLIGDFFIWCSGCDPEILRQCPAAERIRYQGIGATIFLTFVLAILTGGYAIHLIFGDMPISTLGGILWGVIILNMNRLLIGSIKKGGSIMALLAMIIPRFILAIFIAVIIAFPIEIKLFETEIINHILANHRSEITQHVAKEEDKVNKLKHKLDSIYANHRSNIESITRYKLANQTFESSTWMMDKFDKTSQTDVNRYNELRYKDSLWITSEIEYHKNKIDSLNSELRRFNSTNRHLYNTNSNQIGLLDRISTLIDLQSRPEFKWIIFFITLLFLLVEMMPLIFKLLTPMGPYDWLHKEADDYVRISCEHRSEFYSKFQSKRYKKLLKYEISLLTNQLSTKHNQKDKSKPKHKNPKK